MSLFEHLAIRRAAMKHLAVPDLMALLPQRLQVTLTADAVFLQSQDWRGRVEKKTQRLALPPQETGLPSWRPWIQAIQSWLSAQSGRYVLQIRISDRFVRYQHLPWRPGIIGLRERKAYAGHRFREVYGDLAGPWHIALSDTVPGNASVACAIDTDLLAALRDLGPRVQVASVQPMFAHAYNQVRHQCKGKRFWFAHIEPGRVCLALLKNGQGAGIRNEASDQDWPQAVAAIQRRLQLAEATDESPAPLYVRGDLQGVVAPKLLGGHPLHILNA